MRKRTIVISKSKKYKKVDKPTYAQKQISNSLPWAVKLNKIVQG